MTHTLLPPPSVPSGSENVAPNPLYDVAGMVRLIRSVTGEMEEVVRGRLRREYSWPGASVSSEFARRGLKRYVWSDGLVRFYGETDGFLYELAVWNRNWFKARLRAAVCRHISAHGARLGRRLRVLGIGDGLGFDTVEIARAGHDVTYFELPGRAERFARQLFEEMSVPVTVITDLAGASAGSFDVVVCLDVLEHVLEPSTVIAEVAARLRPGGIAMFSAPFFMILPWYPTHLKSNRTHSGSAKLYHRQGLRVVDGSWSWAPVVVCKAQATSTSAVPVNWIKLSILSLTGPFLAVGRWVSWPFVVCHLLRWMANRWFVAPAGSGVQNPRSADSRSA